MVSRFIACFSIVLLSLCFTACSNEPVEFTIEAEEATPDDDSENENPEDIIYATAVLDGQNFEANAFEIDTLSPAKLKLSFFSELEQQIFLILPNPPVQGTYSVTQNNDNLDLYSGAFINSVGNVSESIFYSTADTGDISITSYSSQTGNISGSFEFDVATFNNNIIVITEGEFEVINED